MELSLVQALVSVAVTLLAAASPPPAKPAEPAEAIGVRAVRALESWQDARALAWAQGDVSALRRLYVPGSEAGRRDTAALSAFAERGVRVELRTRSDALAVLVARPDRLVLRERAGVRAVAVMGGRRRETPEVWGWRRLELVRARGGWRLREATAVGPGPASAGSVSAREPP